MRKRRAMACKYIYISLRAQKGDRATTIFKRKIKKEEIGKLMEF